MLDMGTDNEELLDDLLYLGYPHKRLKGKEYNEIVEEFVFAVQEKFPKALIQFEDFTTFNAYNILNKFRDKVLCFNDDIQGTASVALAGLYTAMRIIDKSLKDQKILFLGAGSAATGIANLILKALIEEGMSASEATARLWFVDINGLMVKDSIGLLEHNLPYAHDHPTMGFVDAIRDLKPTILIGASGAKSTFTREVIELMTELNEKPVIFALSNPTSKAECTAEEVYTFSKGKAVFASGSPFKPVEYEGKTFVPGQGNNVYIFPGIGLAAIAVEATALPESVFLIAAAELARQIHQSDLDHGTLYPKLTTLRTISFEIAVTVANHLYDIGMAGLEKPKNIRMHIKNMMYDPSY